MKTQTTLKRFLANAGLALAVAGMATIASAANDKWASDTIADASKAGPPSVTDTASIYGYDANGKLVLARYGTGSYTCIASGSFSLRIGKPPLPYPDPMCLDRNAWSHIQAIWSGQKKNLPGEPGLIWMLAGMNVSKTAVDIGAEAVSVKKDGSGKSDPKVYQMTPHVMILPLPFNEQTADMGTAYALDNPLSPWIMAAGKHHEHLMVHFSDKDLKALMSPSK